MEQKDMPCTVCSLVDANNEIKKVTWCSMCGAWICDECWPKLGKRAEAWAKRIANRILKKRTQNGKRN